MPVYVGASIWTSYALSQAGHKPKEGNRSQGIWVELKKDEPY